MKKILLVLALALSVAAPAFAIDQPGFPNYIIKNSVGAKQGDAVREVKLVRYGNQAQDGASLVSGDLVIWDTNSDDGVTITTTTTSADGRIAGIISSTIPTADSVQNSAQEGAGRRNWGWMVVSGPMVVDLTAAGSNGAAVGDAFITSTDSTVATRFETVPPVHLNGAYNERLTRNPQGGFFLDTPAVGDTSVEVFVHIE